MLTKFVKIWDSFWFAPRSLLNLACLRLVLTGTMFHLYFLRSWNLNYFTEAWFVPRSQALAMMDEALRPAWAWFFWPDSATPWVHAVYVGALFLLFLGLGGRALALLAWVLHMGFLTRNNGVTFGADVICGVFLFYLAFCDSCARLSVRNLWSRKKPRQTSDPLTSAMMRLMQFQICIIYAFTGFEKLKGATWWEGTALWTVLANPQMVQWDWSFLRHVPLVIVAGSFISVLFEVYFPAAMMSRRWRKPWLLLGTAFHLTIGLSMGLMHFSLFMISTYFLFLEPATLERALTWIQGRWKQGLVSE